MQFRTTWNGISKQVQREQELVYLAALRNTKWKGAYTEGLDTAGSRKLPNWFWVWAATLSFKEKRKCSGPSQERRRFYPFNSILQIKYFIMCSCKIRTVALWSSTRTGSSLSLKHHVKRSFSVLGFPSLLQRSPDSLHICQHFQGD